MAEETSAPEDAAPAPAKAPSPWPPLLAVIVLMPAISWATTNFLVLPKIRGAVGEEQTMAAAAKPAEKAAAGHGAAKKETAKGGHGKEEAKGKAKGGESAAGKFSHTFENLVVNLSGAMGSRYLKASFTVFSSDPHLEAAIEENKTQLLDVAITVLGSRTLADLEAAGSKNVVRNDLLANFNQALNSDVIEQVFFSEFVVQ